jgi:hypothetical protein
MDIADRLKALHQERSILQSQIQIPLSEAELKNLRAANAKLQETQTKIVELEVAQLEQCTERVELDLADAGKKILSLGKDSLRFANDVRSLVIALERLNEWLIANQGEALANASAFWTALNAKVSDKDRLARLRSRLFSLFSEDTMRDSVLAPVTSSDRFSYIMSTLQAASKLRTADTAKHEQLAERLRAIVDHSQMPNNTLTFDQIERAAQLAVAVMYRLRDKKDSKLPPINDALLAVFMGQPDVSVSAMIANSGGSATVNSAVEARMNVVIHESRRRHLKPSGGVYTGTPSDSLPIFKAVNMHSSLAELQAGLIGDTGHPLQVVPALSGDPSLRLASACRTEFAAKAMTPDEVKTVKMLAFKEAMEEIKAEQASLAQALIDRKFSLRLDSFDREKMSVPAGVAQFVALRNEK